MFEVYPFQAQCIADLRAGFRGGHVRQLLAAATGSGKTVMVSHMIRSAALKGRKSLFIVDRIVLVEQAARHLRALGLQVGVLQGENTCVNPGDEVVVASIQTLSRRKPPHDIDFIVVDETHILHKHHIKLFEAWNRVPVVGLSATPLRADLGEYYSNLVRGPTPSELMDAGYLVRPTIYCPGQEQMAELLADVHVRQGDYRNAELSERLNRRELIGDIISSWQKLAAGLKTIAFCVDVAHSKAVCDDFLAAGVTAEQLDYRTQKDDRVEIVERFKAGQTMVLTSVNVLGIGFDVPDVLCGIMARPTLSEALFVQQAGRVLRTHPGKDKALLLDHAGNTFRFGLPQNFVVPDLGHGAHNSGKKRQRVDGLVTCSECGAVMEVGQRVCPACGIERPERKSEVHYIDGELSEYGAELATAAPTVEEKLDWYLGFKWIAERSKKGNVGAAYWSYLDKFGEKSPYSWQFLPSKTPTAEMQRFVVSRNIRRAKGKAKQKREEAKADTHRCRKCGSESTVEGAGKGPHHASLLCARCNAFIRWLPKDLDRETPEI